MPDEAQPPAETPPPKPKRGEAARQKGLEEIRRRRAAGLYHGNHGRRIPWSEIRLEYETSLTTTFRGLARKHRCNQWALAARAKTEGWAESREQLRIQREAAARRAAIRRLTEAATRHALSAAKDLQAARQRIMRKLEERMDAKPGADGVAREVANSTKTIVETTTPDGKGGQTVKRAIVTSLGVDNPLSVAVLRQETALLKALLGLRHAPEDSETAAAPEADLPPVVVR